MTVLVTGGAGYIGSHTVVELLCAGYSVVIADDFSNSSPIVLDRIEQICGKRPKFYEIDIRDKSKLEKVFEENSIDSVIHFAGYKAVGESCKDPLKYFDNNFISTIYLLETMDKFGVKKLAFSSSATVYGLPEKVPVTEDMKLSVLNPYGRTKLVIEDMLFDLCKSDSDWSVMLLRYFNPIGAHECGLIGEDPNGIPNNLVPYVAQVAVGKLPYVQVFGDDYKTHDGTGVRDYIHVVDLAKGHLNAIEWTMGNKGIEDVNLGTGKGYSVLDVIKAYEKASGIAIPYKVVGRRPGDADECYCNPDKAKRVLGWSAQYGIEKMCKDSFKWQSGNPNGYKN